MEKDIVKYVRIVNGTIDTDNIVEAENGEMARCELLDGVVRSDSFNVVSTAQLIAAAEIIERELCNER